MYESSITIQESAERMVCSGVDGGSWEQPNSYIEDLTLTNSQLQSHWVAIELPPLMT